MIISVKKKIHKKDVDEVSSEESITKKALLMRNVMDIWFLLKQKVMFSSERGKNE